MITYVTTEYTLSYDDSQDAKDKLFNTMFEWFKKHEMFSGESLAQSDETYIYAPELLGTVAEECFKFNMVERE